MDENRQSRLRTEDAKRFFGTAARLARALGISNAAVAQWGEFVPRLRAIELEEKTAGALPRTGVGIRWPEDSPAGESGVRRCA